MTHFQKRVFQIVKKIPRGNFLTYKKLAKLAGRPRAWRAVGNILNKNPDPNTIPCHRVIRSNGKVGGYKNGQERKIALLKSEHIKLCARPRTKHIKSYVLRCSGKKA